MHKGLLVAGRALITVYEFISTLFVKYDLLVFEATLWSIDSRDKLLCMILCLYNCPLERGGVIGRPVFDVALIHLMSHEVPIMHHCVVFLSLVKQRSPPYLRGEG